MVLIHDADRLVLIDGYLRVEALHRLHRDTAIATTWPVTEIEALVHHRHLSATKRVALEDAWLTGHAILEMTELSGRCAELRTRMYSRSTRGAGATQ